MEIKEYQKTKLRPSLLDRLMDDSLENLAERRLSKAQVHRKIIEICSGKLLNPVAVEFICNVWQRVLVQYCLDEGHIGVMFNKHIDILTRLVNKASPAQFDRNISSSKEREQTKKLVNQIRDELSKTILLPSDVRQMCDQLSKALLSHLCDIQQDLIQLDGDALAASYVDLNLYKGQSSQVDFKLSKLKNYVKRDLAWLLNTTALDAIQDLKNYPRVEKSVLNYGVPNLTGVLVSNINVHALEKHIKRVIINYEPRILKETLTLKVQKKSTMSLNSLSFVIECLVWGEPNPEELIINSEIDLETGSVMFSGMDEVV